MTIVVVSGGFDPLHSGHIVLFNSAKTYGNYLIVGLNSDSWLERKKGRAFMSFFERSAIISNLKAVDEVLSFDDADDTAIELLKTVKERYPGHQIIFANGGDRTATNIPEMEVKDIIFKFGVGGEDKKNSSSNLLDEWKAPKTERPWGYYRILHDVPGLKVKELTINPGQQLSMQQHALRSEYWMIVEGTAILNSRMPGGYSLPSLKLMTHASHTILKNEWHQLTNPFSEPCKLVEIQYGDSCDETDIKRLTE